MDANAVQNVQILGTKRCEVCQGSVLHRCGGCHKIYYCSKQHQRDHWKQHKSICRSYKVGDNSVVAIQGINPGEFVIQEPPLIWGPSFNTIPVCLGCGRGITEENSRPCNKCGWPVCSDLCEKSPGHLPECRYTTQRGERVSIKKFGVPHPIYRCITVLRCLYHKQFLPKSWKRLEKFETDNIINYDKENLTIAEFIRRFFKLAAVFTIEDVLRVCGMVLVYSHEVPLTEPPFIAIYGTTSLIEHNCSPNCSKSFTNQGQILISAVKPIQEGEHLSMCYTDPLDGTHNRRYLLHEQKFFWCHCPRCEDPTEFGTNFNTIKCQSMDCDGYLLPKSFTEILRVPNWICNKCGQTISSYSVHDVLEKIQHDLNDLDRTNIEDCKEFLASYASYLHENHFYIVGIKYVICQMNAEEFSDDDLKLKFNYCQNLEHLIKIIAPAELRTLGRILFEKYNAFNEICRRNEAEHLMGSLQEARKILLEVTHVLKNEPEALPEGKICKQARQKLEEIDDLQKTIPKNELNDA